MRAVPLEPTPEMLEPFARQFCIVQGIDPDKQVSEDWPAWYPMCQGLDECYKAMLAAAPAPVDGLVERLLAEVRTWRRIKSAPKDESYGSFLVLMPKNDAAPWHVLQVSAFEGRLYPDALDCNIDWQDGVDTATHWMPLPTPPRKP